MTIEYAVQPSPDGLAQAFLIAPTSWRIAALVLGDNLFHGHDLVPQLVNSNPTQGRGVCRPVSDPERYGVAEFDADGRVLSPEEILEAQSRYAVTGLYFYDDSVVERAAEAFSMASWRSPISIIDLRRLLRVELMGRGMAWLDTGTCDSLNDVAYIRPSNIARG